jgi:hypothetical protein
MAVVRVRMPPQHQLLDDEEEPEAEQQREPERAGAVAAHTLDRLREQSEQRRAEERPGREAHHVRQQAHAALLRQP